MSANQQPSNLPSDSTLLACASWHDRKANEHRRMHDTIMDKVGRVANWESDLDHHLREWSMHQTFAEACRKHANAPDQRPGAEKQ